MILTIVLIAAVAVIMVRLFQKFWGRLLPTIFLSVWSVELAILLLYVFFGAWSACGTKFTSQNGCAAVLPDQLVGIHTVVLIAVAAVTAYALIVLLWRWCRRILKK